MNFSLQLPAGLQNFDGCSCYVSALVQLLCRTPLLDALKPVNTKDETAIKLFDLLQTFRGLLLNCTDPSYNSDLWEQLVSSLLYYAEPDWYQDRQQRDPSELLAFLIRTLDSPTNDGIVRLTIDCVIRSTTASGGGSELCSEEHAEWLPVMNVSLRTLEDNMNKSTLQDWVRQESFQCQCVVCSNTDHTSTKQYSFKKSLPEALCFVIGSYNYTAGAGVVPASEQATKIIERFELPGISGHYTLSGAVLRFDTGDSRPSAARYGHNTFLWNRGGEWILFDDAVVSIMHAKEAWDLCCKQGSGGATVQSHFLYL
jgi:hypothetical protein